MELRYLSERHRGNDGEIRYAFRARRAARPLSGSTLQHARRDVLSSFFVWLALPNNKFWVNLRRDEPNRIIDDQFGRTDAGRILLEADLRMKKTVAQLIHPDTPTGAQFWRAIDVYWGRHGFRPLCVSLRQWIVPGRVVVFATRARLVIVDSNLNVKLESNYVKREGGAARKACKDKRDRRLEKYAESRFREYILPRIIASVNTSADYRGLRSVFAARVAAEWYERQAGCSEMVFSKTVNTGNAKRWYSRLPWQPRDTYQRYLRSLARGETHFTWHGQHGGVVVTYGGVDFRRIQWISVGNSDRRYLTLSRKVRTAFSSRKGYREDDEVWHGVEEHLELPHGHHPHPECEHEKKTVVPNRVVPGRENRPLVSGR